VAVSSKGRKLLHELLEARSAEYAAGLATLDPALRGQLVKVLRAVLDALSKNAE
jgi:hypothetical protein